MLHRNLALVLCGDFNSMTNSSVRGRMGRSTHTHAHTHTHINTHTHTPLGVQHAEQRPDRPRVRGAAEGRVQHPPAPLRPQPQVLVCLCVWGGRASASAAASCAAASCWLLLVLLVLLLLFVLLVLLLPILPLLPLLLHRCRSMLPAAPRSVRFLAPWAIHPPPPPLLH